MGEEALQLSMVDADWRRVVATAGLGTFDLDVPTGVVGCDPHCRELLGLASDVRVSCDEIASRVHADDRERVLGALRRVMAAAGADVHRDEFRCAASSSGAERWVALAGRVLRDADGRAVHFVGVAWDSTAPRRAAQERERALAEAARTVHVGELFAGILGHDLRAPLTAITAAADLGLREPPDARAQLALQRIQQNARRMARMIDQLLDFTRARANGGVPLALENIDLDVVSRAVVQDIRDAHTDWSFQVESHGDVHGRWDADRLAQVVSNLVCNAVEHGERAGGVRVELDGTGADVVTLAVANRGVIPAATLPLLFNPFRAVHQGGQKSSGLGLGLYITAQIGRAHGGDVEALSPDAEGGTRIVVRLPRQPSRAPHRPTFSGADEELAALAALARPPESTDVTARLFGDVPLAERAPEAYWRMLEDYARLLDAALERHAFKDVGAQVSDDLRALAERLGALDAGAREVAELHARALRQVTRSARFARSQALVTEGRLLSFELMGHLLSWYRRRARRMVPGAAARTPRG